MSESLKLLLVGDVMLGRGVNERLRGRPPSYPWGDTLPLFEEADWRACNLECVLSDHGAEWQRPPKRFHFRSDGRNTAVLKAARLDAVSLANNHTLDFNHRALTEMLQLLDRAGIAHAGAGRNHAEASRMALVEVSGTRIGMIAFTDNEPAWEADAARPGVLYVPVDTPDSRTEALLEAVRASAARVDLLVVSAHWGGNWGRRPPESHRILAHRLVEAGADIVFGHSAHVGRGIETVAGSVILYSAGDFVDDYAVDPVERNDRSWMFELRVGDRRIQSVHLHPTVIRDCQARLAGASEAREMTEDMCELCASLGTRLEVDAVSGPPVIRLR